MAICNKGIYLDLEKCKHIIFIFIIILLIGVGPGVWARDVTFLHISDQHYGSKNFDPNVLKVTIDAMNALPGTPYPDNIGGVVGGPMGVILTGDLTDSGLPDQWSEFVADWGLVGSDGRLNYPVYEGVGNHDGPVSSANGKKGYVRRQIIQRNKIRPHVVNVSANGLHYSWDWQDVHFVQLNEYAGLDDSSRYSGNLVYNRKAQAYGNPAEKSLQFLEQDLASKVGKSKRPVVLCQHYGFDGFAFRPWGDERAWWTEKHALRLWEVIEGYNVIAILAGHDGSEAVFNWNGIPNYHMDDSVRFRVYHITDNGMSVAQRNSETNQWETIRTQSALIDAAMPSELLQGPYLIYPNDPTKMTVCWRCDSNLSCELKWGNVYFQYEAGEAKVQPYDTENHLYKYTITDLKPDTRYSYLLEVDGKYAPGMFYTAPDSNETKVKFFAYANPRSNLSDHEKADKAVYDKLYEDPAYHTFLLHTGKWDEQFFSREPNDRIVRYIQSRLPIMGPIGAPDSDRELYQKLLPYTKLSDQHYYSFDYGPVHIAIIDRNKEYSLKSDQYSWLKKDLENTNKDWKLLLFRSYAENIGNQSSNKDIQEHIQPLCETYGVDICLSGHNHSYIRTEVGGVKYITTSGGDGARLYDAGQSSLNVTVVSKASYFAIQVEDKMLTFEVFDDTGEHIDSFTTQETQGLKDFADDFNANHDYLVQGVSDTSWDGFIGQGRRETADRVESADGKLYLQSTNGRYEGDWNPLGPLLYKTVTGDFKATVRVVDYQRISYNNCGIMARAANLDDAGKGEDWVSIDYFPIYAGIYGRMADDNRRKENGNNGQGRSADTYLQLELVGNMFFLRHSSDGIKWKDLSCSPITRNDLVNVPLQVGPFQATYSRNQGYVAFEDFTLESGGQVKTARIHFPEDGVKSIPTALSLSWIPGSGAGYHDIYFGTPYKSVKTAHNEMPKGTSVYKGRQAISDIDYDIAGLKDGTTYYWRIDEVADEQIHQGAVWSFTVYDRSLANFEHYNSEADLTSAWSVGGTATVTLSDAAPPTGKQSLQLDFDNTVAPHYAQVEFTFMENQDWMSSFYSFRSLSVYFKGNTNNRSGKLYMIFEDNDWGTSRTVVEYDGDPTHLQRPVWTRWDIDLQTLVANNPAFRLNSVKKMALAIGHPDCLDVGGSGTVYFDDIAIQYKRAIDENQPSGSQDSWPNYIQPEKFVEAVPFDKVTVTGGLWRERMDINRTVSLPHVWDKCEYFKKANGQDSRRLDNFRKATGEKFGGFTGTYFNDSDVYKIIEGTAYSLKNHPDPKLEAYTDAVIDSIAGAQWDDGYLYTFYSIPHKPSSRWTNIGSMHELYCAGHLFEGAVAYYKATGKRKLLDVAIKFADLICDTFGPGKKMNPPGHQEIELALMKLYNVTGNQRYMETAKFFIDQRGNSNGHGLYGTYSQDHIPFVEQEKGVGHSVRAGYLYCAAMDIAMLNHDEAYGNTLFRLWDNITNTKTYITGGIGQPGGPEGFANDYELGNSCYAETCSGIAFAMWNHRLHQMTGESKYLDVMERTLLNNILSSLSQEGDKHYYTNPLMTGGRSRWEWPGHDCACCPSNLVRVIASIGGYAYSHKGDTINVNMYMQGKATVPLLNNSITLTQTTNYPWDGDIRIDVQPEKPDKFGIKLRIPGWARNMPMPGNLYKYLNESNEQVTLEINGSPVDVDIEKGYVTIERTWQASDKIHLVLPLPIRRVIAHPKATADEGLVTIERGPIVYCAEFKDNSFDAASLKLSDSANLTATFEQNFFSGVVTITSDSNPKLKLIPYYLYANRGEGWMRVWISRN